MESASASVSEHANFHRWPMCPSRPSPETCPVVAHGLSGMGERTLESVPVPVSCPQPFTQDTADSRADTLSAVAKSSQHLQVAASQPASQPLQRDTCLAVPPSQQTYPRARVSLLLPPEHKRLPIASSRDSSDTCIRSHGGLYSFRQGGCLTSDGRCIVASGVGSDT